VRVVALMMTGSYDHRLVGLSVAFALLAAYAAIDLTGRVTATGGWATDAVLYCAKRAGRDQVMVAEPLATTEMAAAAVFGEVAKS
jgi:hypothetical protein